MLRHLTIENFALIAHHEIHFDNGMTVITGETGAGKSIVIDALSLALGSRADTQMIRHGSDKCIITAEFNIEQLKNVKAWLADNDFAHDEDCIIRRVVQKDGKSRALINGSPVTLQQLSELGDQLVDLHGQHEHQSLLRKDQQLKLLDQFGKHENLLGQIEVFYQQWRDLEAQQTLLKNAQDKTTLREFYQFQLEELEALALQENEVAQLEAEFKKLNQADSVLLRSNTALNILSEDNINLIDMLNQVSQQLEPLSDFSEELKNANTNLANAEVALQETIHDIKHYLSHFDHSPERLAEISSRLDEIHRIARKHHVTPSELLAVQTKISQELNQLEDVSGRLAAIEQEQQKLLADYHKIAATLSKKRQQAGDKLAKAICEKMHELAMPGGKFVVKFNRYQDQKIHEQGEESCEFLVSANPDQPAQALNKVASGGELSRISLAIQVILASQATNPTLIFDEVDVGIGGATAAIVGKSLKALGKKTQVICITHLPQVAAFGEHHIRIQKNIVGQTTQTSLEKLSQQDRQHEIARMLGGLKITEQSLANAKVLLEQE